MQIWDVAESASFEAALLEVSDNCYCICFEQLRRNVYTFDNSDFHHSDSRAPPFASLLPQIKAIASSLLPNDARSVDIRDIVSGPLVESLCDSVFDAVIEPSY